MKAQKNTKIMVTCALLVALQVILARFLSAPCGLWPWAR